MIVPRRSVSGPQGDDARSSEDLEYRSFCYRKEREILQDRHPRLAHHLVQFLLYGDRSVRMMEHQDYRPFQRGLHSFHPGGEQVAEYLLHLTI